MDSDKVIQRRFTTHLLDDQQQERYNDVRLYARSYVRVLCNVCPSSRELSLALTKLEEVVFWANAAIAREDVPEE